MCIQVLGVNVCFLVPFLSPPDGCGWRTLKLLPFDILKPISTQLPIKNLLPNRKHAPIRPHTNQP